jgi:hypothetical protein
MTKKEFSKAAQAIGGTTQYSGKKKTMFVHGIDQTKFNQHFGRHFAMNVNFKVAV